MPSQLDQLLGLVANKTKRQGFDPNFLADENIDPSVRADAGMGAMQGELTERLFNAERTQPPPRSSGLYQSPNATNPFEVDALQRLLNSYTQERDDPRAPLNMQAVETANQRKLNLGAMNEGFTGGPGQSPIQAREIYKRGLDEEKMRQPIQEQNIIQQNTNLRLNQSQAHNQKIVEMQMAPAMEDAQTRKAFNDAILQGKVQMPNDLYFGGNNRYGPQFRPLPRDPNNNLLPVQRDLARAEPGSDDYMQSARTLVAQSLRHNPQLAANFVEWLSDPDPLPFEEAFVPESNKPDDIRDFRELVRLATIFGRLQQQ